MPTLLHAHSHFSFSSGLLAPEELVKLAQKQGYSSVALCDTNSTSGLFLFREACIKFGLKPILGIELKHPHNPQDCLCIIAQNFEGYRALCQISTHYLSHCKNIQEFGLHQLFSSIKNTAEYSVEFQHTYKYLRVTTSNAHTLQQLYQIEGQPLKGKLFAELTIASQKQRALSRELYRLAQKLQLPYFANQEVHFATPEDFELHKVRCAIELNASLSQLSPCQHAPQGAWLKPAQKIKELFERTPKAWEENLDFENWAQQDYVPQKWVLPHMEKNTPKEVWDEKLKRATFKGFFRNFPLDHPDFSKALEIQRKELKIIKSKDYSSYFLMVQHIRNWANKRFSKGYRRPKDCTVLRGSAANSITLYNLGASDLDPIKYDLYFERFLNEDRVSPPDADLDFGWDERDQVIKHIFEHFGEERCAIICTYNHMRWRSAFRQVARVLGYTDNQINELVQLHRKTGSKDKIDPDIHEHSNSSEPKTAAYQSTQDVKWLKLLDYAHKLTGKPSHYGQHPGGILIVNDSIDKHVVCQYTQTGRKITQIDMHSGVDFLGLIKLDILGNGSLSVLRDALDMIKSQSKPDPEVWNLEKCYKDIEVQKMLKNSGAKGVFYLESPAQMRLNEKAQAGKFQEIGVTSSLIRPAGTSFTETYAQRHKAEKLNLKAPPNWQFLHPSLKSVLGDTHDVIVFQEDVVKICVEIAGFSFAQADKVRKMMNSHHEGVPENYNQTRDLFISGCQKFKGLNTEQALELWSRVASFTGFSFCKSHSLSYAQLSFKCAYLKAHHPAEFLAAVISNKHGFYGTHIYLDEARRMGVEILPIHLHLSQYKTTGQIDQFTPSKKTYIRLGFMHIKSLQKSKVEQLIIEREKNPFNSLQDLLKRVPSLNHSDIESLIKVGTLNHLSTHHPMLLAQTHLWFNSTHKEEVNSAQVQLFLEDSRELIQSNIPQLKDFSFAKKSYHELYYQGFMSAANSLEILSKHPAAINTIFSTQIRYHKGRSIKVFGSPVTHRTHRVQKSGKLMMFLTLQDLYGSMDIIIWPSQFERCEHLAFEHAPMEIWGTVKEDLGTFSIELSSMRLPLWSPNQKSLILGWENLQTNVHQQNSKVSLHRISKAAELSHLA